MKRFTFIVFVLSVALVSLTVLSACTQPTPTPTPAPPPAAKTTPAPAPAAGSKTYAIDRITIRDNDIELRLAADGYWSYAPNSRTSAPWTITVNEGDTIQMSRLSSSSDCTKDHAFTIKGLGTNVPLKPGDTISPYELKIPAGSAGTHEITSSADPGLFEGKCKIVVQKRS